MFKCNSNNDICKIMTNFQTLQYNVHKPRVIMPYYNITYSISSFSNIRHTESNPGIFNTKTDVLHSVHVFVLKFPSAHSWKKGNVFASTL